MDSGEDRNLTLKFESSPKYERQPRKTLRLRPTSCSQPPGQPSESSPLDRRAITLPAVAEQG